MILLIFLFEIVLKIYCQTSSVKYFLSTTHSQNINLLNRERCEMKLKRMRMNSLEMLEGPTFGSIFNSNKFMVWALDRVHEFISINPNIGI